MVVVRPAGRPGRAGRPVFARHRTTTQSDGTLRDLVTQIFVTQSDFATAKPRTCHSKVTAKPRAFATQRRKVAGVSALAEPIVIGRAGPAAEPIPGDGPGTPRHMPASRLSRPAGFRTTQRNQSAD